MKLRLLVMVQLLLLMMQTKAAQALDLVSETTAGVTVADVAALPQSICYQFTLLLIRLVWITALHLFTFPNGCR